MILLSKGAKGARAMSIQKCLILFKKKKMISKTNNIKTWENSAKQLSIYIRFIENIYNFFSTSNIVIERER